MDRQTNFKRYYILCSTKATYIKPKIMLNSFWPCLLLLGDWFCHTQIGYQSKFTKENLLTKGYNPNLTNNIFQESVSWLQLIYICLLLQLLQWLMDIVARAAKLFLQLLTAIVAIHAHCFTSYTCSLLQFLTAMLAIFTYCYSRSLLYLLYFFLLIQLLY